MVQVMVNGPDAIMCNLLFSGPVIAGHYSVLITTPKRFYNVMSIMLNYSKSD
jgi:hypothetical protein